MTAGPPRICFLTAAIVDPTPTSTASTPNKRLNQHSALTMLCPHVPHVHVAAMHAWSLAVSTVAWVH